MSRPSFTGVSGMLLVLLGGVVAFNTLVPASIDVAAAANVIGATQRKGCQWTGTDGVCPFEPGQTCGEILVTCANSMDNAPKTCESGKTCHTLSGCVETTGWWCNGPAPQ